MYMHINICLHVRFGIQHKSSIHNGADNSSECKCRTQIRSLQGSRSIKQIVEISCHKSKQKVRGICIESSEMYY